MVHYQNNGTGRDQYIFRDNGGFSNMHKPTPYKYGHVGSFSAKRRYVPPAPSKMPLNVYYRSDGTGRDSYIVSGSGGLTSYGNLIHYKDAFKRSLRAYDDPRITLKAPYVKLGGKDGGYKRALSSSTYQRMQTLNPYTDHTMNDSLGDLSKLNMSQTASSGGFHKKRDYLVESQLTFDSKFYHQQKQLRDSQKSLDERLSRPKHSRRQLPPNDENRPPSGLGKLTIPQIKSNLHERGALGILDQNKCDVQSSRPQIYSLINKQKQMNSETASICQSVRSLNPQQVINNIMNFQSARNIQQRTRNQHSDSSNYQETIKTYQTVTSLDATSQQCQISCYDKIEQLKFEYFEAKEGCELNLDNSSHPRELKDLMRKMLEKFDKINQGWESLCETLASELFSKTEKEKTMKKEMKDLKDQSLKRMAQQEREFQKTQKRYERSLGDIRCVYERSSRLVNENLDELELMAQELKQKRAKLGVKHQVFMKTVEQEMNHDDAIVSQSGRINFQSLQHLRQNSIDQLEQTSKYSICISSRNHIDQQQLLLSSIENDKKKPSQNNYLEKTTPRSSRPGYIPPQQIQKVSMIKRYENKNKGNHQKIGKKGEDQSVEITRSFDLSNIQTKKDSEQSTNVKQYIVDSVNKNDESVYAPAFIIGEKDPEWDSFLDDTKVNINQDELNFIQKDYLEKLSQIPNPDEKIIYSLQHKVDANILTQFEKLNQNCKTPQGKANCYQLNQKSSVTKKLDPQSIDMMQDNTHKIYSSFQSVHKPSNRKVPDSSCKKYKYTDVKLSEVLDVSNAIITQSPLPQLPTEEKLRHSRARYLNQDVALEDILNVKSLSISLRTATDAGGFQQDEPSFLKSDIKKSNFKYLMKTDGNESCFVYQDDEIIHDSNQPHQNQVDNGFRRNINREVFNIIDDHNQNGELSGTNLEESSSSYSRTEGSLQFKDTQKTLVSQFIREGGNSEYEEYKSAPIDYEDRKNSGQKYVPESFKSTALMAAVSDSKQCLENLQLSHNNSQVPTPAFNYRQKSEKFLNEYGQVPSNNDPQFQLFALNGQDGQAQEIKLRKGNHLALNHNKLIEKIKEKCSDQMDISTQAPVSQSSQSFIHQDYSTMDQAVQLRASSQQSKPQKLKLNLIRSKVTNQAKNVNKSVITVIEKKNLKIPIRQIVRQQSSDFVGVQTVQNKKNVNLTYGV